MNKLFFVALIAITTLSFTSCGTYKSARDSNSATRGVGSSLLGKIGPILIQDLGKSVLPQGAGAAGLMSKLNMGTKLNSVIKGATMVNSFKSMLSGNYGISSDKVDAGYGKLKTLKDVAGFVGKNASPSFLSSLK
jgi:hypothetical protein